MRMVKRVICLILIALLTVLPVAGCSGKTDDVGNIGLVGGKESSSGKKDKTEKDTQKDTQKQTETSAVGTQASTETSAVGTPTQTQPVTQTSTQEQTTTQGTTQASFETEFVETDEYYITIPKGWKVKILYWYQKPSYIFQVYDPNNADREIVIWADFQIGYPNQETKNTWLMVMGGYGSVYKQLDANLCPVVDDVSAGTMLGMWEEYRTYFSSGDSIGSLREFTDFTVTGADPVEGVFTANAYGFDTSESVATATCKGPSGASCTAYMYSASTYMNVGGTAYSNSNYFQALHGITIMVPDDYFNAYAAYLYQCAWSLGFKSY